MFRKKKTYIWLVIILAVVFGGYYYLNSKKPKTTYTTQNVTRGTLARTVSVTGKLFSKDQVDLAFPVIGGEVVWLDAEVGQHVTKGQVLAKFDSRSLLESVRQAEQEVKYQKRTFAHMDDNKAFDNDQELAQRAKIKEAESALQVAKINFYKSVLTAPVDGVIVAKNIEKGEVALVNSPILTIARSSELEIQSNVPESDIVKLQVGQKANVIFDALPSEDILSAEVTEIDPASTVIQDVVYYRVKFKLNAPDARLKIGMSEDIDVLTASKDNVLMIPLRAVKTEGKERFVEVLKDEVNNVTEKIKITTGLEGDEGMVEVASGNLKEGDKVITLVNAPK
jgi:HlyD family secretion protein